MTNTWIDADSEQELLTRCSWSDPVESLTQMDFIMSSRKSEIRRVQVLDSDWFKTDHRAVFTVFSLKTKMRHSRKSDANFGWLEARLFLGKSGCRNVDRLVKLECDGASAVGNGEVTQKIGIQGDASDRARAQIAAC